MHKIQGLLNWCKNQLNSYPNITISNFTSSWKDGLAFNGLIHRFKPDLINYHELDSGNVYYNNYIAFKTAEIHLGIPSLLDPKDMSNMECPERLSIITYVSQFYNCLKNMAPEGGYNINKFENTNNDNSDFETISSRASVGRLKKLKCTICHLKVYLLERYVADDKLYHRKCYRTLQILNIDNESEVIGDYLNIYGELKPTMNKDIFVHPLQGLTLNDNAIDFKTSDPVNITEEIDSEVEDSDILSESLSSYGFSENISDDEIDVFDYDTNYLPNDGVVDCNYDKNQNTIKGNNDQFKKTCFSNDNIIKHDKEFKRVSCDEPLNKKIENVIIDNSDNKYLEIVDKDKYIEFKDINENIFILNVNNTVENKMSNIENDANKDARVLELQEIFLLSTLQGSVDKMKNENNLESEVIENKDFILSIETKKNKDNNNRENKNIYFKEFIDDYKSSDYMNLSKYKEEKIFSSSSSSCQENLLSTITVPAAKPIKQRLYIKKRDKKLPYSTFFEVTDDAFINAQTQDLEQNVSNEISIKELDELSKIQENIIIENEKQANSFESSELVKKLIEIIPDEEFESDVSSLDDEIYETLKPKITRNSIWRKPIISSIISKKHKSTCVPIEGKFRDYAEFKDRLEELNSKQSDIESRARKIQQRLWEEDSNSPLYELLLAKWLDLVEEKDKIFYEENALYSWIKDLKLQEMKMKLEAQIRLLSSSGFNDPTSSQKEKELIDKLIETVNQRSELVDAMNEENIRRLETHKLRHECIENHSKIGSSSKYEAPKLCSPVKSIKKFWKRKTSHF